MHNLGLLSNNNRLAGEMSKTSTIKVEVQFSLEDLFKAVEKLTQSIF
ncbi:hypothetical protein Cylst_1140 [Cylindrospermum stagnale PCC 7417]|uniref:Uncharacterized protein n=1 Tax=Cylindrospermum stagnale PCC 7417 TaxID=56107 RepID=K9WST1_9NOST|nr:hypothetical protein Cylst_1140 [Cylindrospermum stagnale PCC 7417]